MTWQDLVFTVGGSLFGVLLLPTLLNRESYIPRWSSIPTFAILALYVPVFWSLGLLYSTLAEIVVASAWFGIVLFRGSKRPEHDTPESTNTTAA
jgi:hypothetical protein